jgi:putative FmdB family regulatory protein
MDNQESACRLVNECEYQCYHCRHVFRSSVMDTPSSEKPLKCPACGGTDVGRLPSWAPLGFDSARVPAEWEYECQQCHHTFKLPPPSGPSQEIACPACGGKRVHRLTIISGEPLYCG